MYLFPSKPQELHAHIAFICQSTVPLSTTITIQIPSFKIRMSQRCLMHTYILDLAICYCAYTIASIVSYQHTKVMIYPYCIAKVDTRCFDRCLKTGVDLLCNATFSVVKYTMCDSQLGTVIYDVLKPRIPLSQLPKPCYSLRYLCNTQNPSKAQFLS